MNVILPHITAYVRGNEDAETHSAEESVGSLAVLAERAGVAFGTLEKYVYEYAGHRSMLFDDADKILCALGKVDLWRGELNEYYENVNLHLAQCAHPNCLVWYEPTRSNHIYCSTACANSAKRGNRRIKHFKGKAMKGEHSFRCRNGHVRTPETTITLKSGKIRCRICNNETSMRSYRKARAAS